MSKRFAMQFSKPGSSGGCTTCGNTSVNKSPIRSVGGMFNRHSAQRQYLDHRFEQANHKHKQALQERKTMEELYQRERAERERANAERANAERERAERERANAERAKANAERAKANAERERERVERQQLRAEQKKAKEDNSHAIHVYGAEWCGFTKKQNKEIRDALTGSTNIDKKHIYIDCAKDKGHHVCQEMNAFPLTVVHERGKKYTLDELTKINQPGYRPGNMVVDELIRKIGSGSKPAAPAPAAPAPAAPAPAAPAPAAPAPAPASAPVGDKAIHVYGAEWCGFTRKQNEEIKEALKDDPNAAQKHVYIDCASDKTNGVCKGLQGFPLTVIHERGKQYTLEELMKTTQPGYRPGKLVVGELHGEAPPAPERFSKLDVVQHTPGDGKTFPEKGDVLTMHYVGLLAANNNKFDSSVDRGKPFEFTIGAGQVIAGWDQGIMKMSLGEKAALKIPASLGYGQRGTGPIPPDSDLVFLVELLDIKKKNAPAAAAPAPDKNTDGVGSPAIHVYGAEWCGFTKKQNNEIKEALAKEPQGGNAHVYIDCAGSGKDNPVCNGMPGFPLTVVHERGKKYTLQELMKMKQPGYRPGATVVAEWKEACGKAPPKNNVQFEINSSSEKKDKAIHVYGANWCGFTRSQISELKETLKHETGGLESLQVHVCTDEKLATEHKKICGGLQGYPFTLVAGNEGPKEPIAELLKKHRMGKRPAAEVVGEWKKACGDNSPVKAPAPEQTGGCKSCGDK